MRYIQVKTIVTKVSDDEINSTEEIKTLLSALQAHNIDCMIRLKDGHKVGPSRIKDVRDADFSFCIIGRSVLNKASTYDNLDCVEVDMETKVVARKTGSSRWMLLNSDDCSDQA